MYFAAVNNVLNNWYLALQFAAQQASQDVAQIIDIVDPPNELNVKLDLVLAILMVSFSLMLAPEFSFIKGAVAKAEFAIIATSFVDAPFLARAIVPTVTEDSRLIQIGDLSNYLRNMTTDLSNQINAGLSILMTDINSFTAFAGSGRYSGPNTTSIPDEQNKLALGLTTWVLSYALQNNDYITWYGTNMTDGLVPTVDSAATNFGCTAEPGGFCAIPDKKKGAQKQQSGWATWGSPDTQQFFSITKDPKKKKVKHASGSDILNATVAKGWSTLPLLFDGGYNCTNAAAMADTPRDSGVTWELDGSFSCISQLEIGPGCGTWRNRVTPWGPVARKPDACKNFFGNG